MADALAGDQRLEALGLVNTVLGAGKDALARTYVALASRADSPLGQQPAVTGAVVKGTAGTLAVDDGLAGAVVRTEVLGQSGHHRP